MVEIPADFDQWPPAARRAYLSRYTQKEQLALAADSLGLDLEIGTDGSLTNRDLGQFVTELLCEGVA